MCGGVKTNAPERGGTARCFHCALCSFVECADSPHTQCEAELDALRVENTRLRKALAPFGALADAYDPPEDDNDDITWHRKPTLGQLRAARAALLPPQAEP